MVSAHLSQVGSWKYTRLSNLPNATQEVNGSTRDKLQVSQSSFLVSYKTIPSLPQKHRQYMKQEYQQIQSISELSDIPHA